jgi:phosphatidylglycerophosphate synthase
MHEAPHHHGFQHWFNIRWQGVRIWLYEPIMRTLDWCGFTPGIITAARLIMCSFFIATYNSHRILAVSIIAIALLLDSVDGALARFQKNESDRGKFFDIFVDLIAFIVILSTFTTDIGSAALVYATSWSVGALWLLATIYKEEGHTSDWIIKPYPREIFTVIIPITAFFFAELQWIDIRHNALWIVLIYALTASVVYLFLLLRRWKLL